MDRNLISKNMEPINSNEKGEASRRKKMTPEEFREWSDKRSAIMLANLEEELKKPEYHDVISENETENPIKKQIRLKYALEILKKSIRDNGI